MSLEGLEIHTTLSALEVELGKQKEKAAKFKKERNEARQEVERLTFLVAEKHKRKEAIRAVLWPRDKVGVAYRYAIVGMVFTDYPIPNLEGHNELVVDGDCPGLAELLNGLPTRKPKLPLGEASSVLCNLGII